MGIGLSTDVCVVEIHVQIVLGVCVCVHVKRMAWE